MELHVVQNRIRHRCVSRTGQSVREPQHHQALLTRVRDGFHLDFQLKGEARRIPTKRRRERGLRMIRIAQELIGVGRDPLCGHAIFARIVRILENLIQDTGEFFSGSDNVKRTTKLRMQARHLNESQLANKHRVFHGVSLVGCILA